MEEVSQCPCGRLVPMAYLPYTHFRPKLQAEEAIALLVSSGQDGRKGGGGGGEGQPGPRSWQVPGFCLGGGSEGRLRGDQDMMPSPLSVSEHHCVHWTETGTLYLLSLWSLSCPPVRG